MASALRRRIVPTLVLALAFATGTSAAHAACTGGRVSAIDQYCETIPTPTGTQGPAGSPELGSALPPQTALTMVRSRRLFPLLLLPARPKRLGQSHGSVPQVASVSPWSLSLGLVLILLAIAVVLAALAAAGWWRRRSAEHQPG